MLWLRWRSIPSKVVFAATRPHVSASMTSGARQGLRGGKAATGSKVARGAKFVFDMAFPQAFGAAAIRPREDWSVVRAERSGQSAPKFGDSALSWLCTDGSRRSPDRQLSALSPNLPGSRPCHGGIDLVRVRS